MTLTEFLLARIAEDETTWRMSADGTPKASEATVAAVQDALGSHGRWEGWPRD